MHCAHIQAMTPEEEDAVLDKLFTADGVFGIEQQSSILEPEPIYRAFFKAAMPGSLKGADGRRYMSCVGRSPSEAYRAAQAALVAEKFTCRSF